MKNFLGKIEGTLYGLVPLVVTFVVVLAVIAFSTLVIVGLMTLISLA